ncbi:telomerase reverse transcriptase-like isoform X2 [Artemia franciscana]|uniref:telomerase reverse transcriptase-like isoform X2 n=1 Tax=Artemia franciscana TaxID=6661 RepID=UPI0032DBE824
MRPKNSLRFLHPNKEVSLLRQFLPANLIAKVSSKNTVITSGWIVYDKLIEDSIKLLLSNGVSGTNQIGSTSCDVFQLIRNCYWDDFCRALGKLMPIVHVSRFAFLRRTQASELQERAVMKRKYDELCSTFGKETHCKKRKVSKGSDPIQTVKRNNKKTIKKKRSFDKRRPYDPRSILILNKVKGVKWKTKLDFSNLIDGCNGAALLRQIQRLDIGSDKTVHLECREALDHSLPALNSFCTSLKGVNPFLFEKSIHKAPGFSEISKAHIFNFIKKIIDTCLPKSLLGGRCNIHNLQEKVKKIVFRTHYQEFDLQEVMEGIKWSYFKWTKDYTDSVRQCAAGKLIMWLLAYFVPFITSSCFIISKKSASYDLVYYHKVAWLKQSAKNTRDMLKNKKLEVINKTLAEKRLEDFHCSGVVKWIPKPDGCARMITKVKKPSDAAARVLENDALIVLQAMAANFQCRVPTKPDSVVVHKRWKTFRQSLEKSNIKKIHFASSDVKDAYGSIKHTPMIDLLWRYYDEEYEPFFGSFCSAYKITVATPGKKSKAKSHYYTHQVHDVERFFEKLPNSCVIVSAIKIRDINVMDTLKYVETCIQNVILNQGTSFYRMTEGLPQGWALSGALCDIYLGYFNRLYIDWPLEGDSYRLMLRGVDDYLYLSNDENDVRRMVQATSKDYPDFGISFKNTKCSSSLDLESGGFVSENRKWANFCGVAFDTNLSGVRLVFKDLTSKALLSTLRIQNSRDTSRFLVPKLTRTLVTKMGWIALDPTINTITRRRENLRDMFLFTMMRFTCLVKYVLGKIRSAGFLFRIITELKAVIVTKFTGFLRYKGCIPFGINSAIYMFIHIAQRFMKKHPDIYGRKILFMKVLKSEAGSKLKRLTKRRLQKVICTKRPVD